MTESWRRGLNPPGGRWRKSLLQKGRADSEGRWIASRNSIRPLSALALAQSRILCLQDGLQEVVQHRLLTGQDLRRHRHAGDDRQQFAAVVEGVLLGAQVDVIEALALLDRKRVV